MALPGNNNTFVPSFEASGKIQVEYSRNPNKFAVNKYCQIVPVTKGTGLYLNISPDDAGRLMNSGKEFVWHDGNDAPRGTDNTQDFSWSSYITTRYAPTFSLGNKTVKQADWDIVASHGRMVAQQQMNVRTKKAVTLLTTSGNFSGRTATATVASGSGGKFDVSTSANQYIKKGLNYAFTKIQLATYSVVQPSDVMIVMNPSDAFALAAAPEIVDYAKNNNFGLAAMRGEAPVYVQYGLPDQLYGFQVVVEDASAHTANKGGTVTSAYLWPTASITMVSRIGGLEGVYGAPSFSSATIFELENMTVETKDDPDNRRTTGRVVDDFDIQMTSTAASYLLTACTG